MEPRTLTCDGQLIAHVDLADPYGYDRDWYDHVFLFKNDNGYELLVVSRHERYDVEGALTQAAARIDLTALPSAQALQEAVERRWPTSSSAWWRLLARAQEHDPDLYQLWVPERMKHDLELSTVRDDDLATKTSYLGGHALDAPRRHDANWHDEAVASITAELSGQGWHIRPGPELSDNVEPGGHPAAGAEVVGSLWATRYGHEVPLVVRVDACGAIYARFAEPDDIIPPPTGVHATTPEPRATVVDDGRQRDPMLVRDALEDLLDRCPDRGCPDRPRYGLGMER